MNFGKGSERCRLLVQIALLALLLLGTVGFSGMKFRQQEKIPCHPTTPASKESVSARRKLSRNTSYSGTPWPRTGLMGHVITDGQDTEDFELDADDTSIAESRGPPEMTTTWTNPAMDRRSAGSAMASVASAVTAATFGLTVGELPAKAATASNNNRIPTWTLPGAVKMPVLALNTVGLSKDDTERAVGYALQQGMTHIDFHPGPKERDGVAAYLQKNPKSRSKLFLNTKIRKAPPGTSPEDAAQRTRQQIDEDLNALFSDTNMKPQVDMLMLRDSPDCAVIQAQWKVLEEALQRGQCRSIGVINFCQGALECLLQTAKVTPAVNYYMLHVGMGRDAHGLRTFGESRGIKTFVYGVVGEPGPNAEILNSPVLKKIGKAHGNKSPEQVALRWVLQTGAAVSVRPTLQFGLGTSVCDADSDDCLNGLAGRSSSFNWSLTDVEMSELDAMTSPDDNPTLFSSAGCPGAFVMPK